MQPLPTTDVSEETKGPPEITASQQLAEGVSRAGKAYWDCIKEDPDLRRTLGSTLDQEPGPEAANMAVLVMTQFLAQVKPNRYPNLTKITKAWHNATRTRRSKSYRPGMELALDLLNILPKYKLDRQLSQPREMVQATIQEMCRTADLIKDGLPGNDLAGPLLQQLPQERRELSNYHTQPWAATLMAHLALPDDFEWGNPERVKDFHIADYACGSGALLMAAYRRIRELHRTNGGNPESIHEHMMANSITGGDALPACNSICSSNLAMTERNRPVWKTRIVPFKKDKKGRKGKKRQGALDLVNRGLKDRQPLIAMGATGAANKARTVFKQHDQDAILMNPPYGTRMAGDGNDTTSDGSGLACKFAHMTHEMIRRGGMIALTLPGNALIGMTNRPQNQPQGWQSFRHMIRTKYTQVKVVSIAQYDDKRSSLSHDTNIAETMIIARRLRVKEKAPRTAHYINLTRQARDDDDAARMAEAIKEAVAQPDSPLGTANRIQMDGEDLGTVVLLPLPQQGAWPMAKNLNPELLMAARALAENQAKSDPRTTDLRIPLTDLLNIAAPGPNNTNSCLEPLTPLESPPDQGPRIPVLHGHHCTLQKSMTVAPTHWIADPQTRGLEALAAKHHTPGFLHLSNNTRYTSQAIAAAFTPQMTIGDVGWTTLTVQGTQIAKALAAWLNSTVGMLVCWPYLHHTQNGTGYTTARQLDGLPVIDLSRIGRAQIDALARAFDSMANTDLMPACDAWHDTERKALDRKVLAALGLGDAAASNLEWLRNNWCLEPTVQGMKGQVEYRRPDMEALAEMARAVLPAKPRDNGNEPRKKFRQRRPTNDKPANIAPPERYNPLEEPATNAAGPPDRATTIRKTPVFSIHLTERTLPGNALWIETKCGIAVTHGKSVTATQRRDTALQQLHPDFWCDHCLDLEDNHQEA